MSGQPSSRVTTLVEAAEKLSREVRGALDADASEGTPLWEWSPDELEVMSRVLLELCGPVEEAIDAVMGDGPPAAAETGGDPVRGAPHYLTRWAEPGEVCICGHPAVLVFVGGPHGDTGYCGQRDGGDQGGPCPFCGGDRHGGRCPDYQLWPATGPTTGGGAA